MVLRLPLVIGNGHRASTLAQFLYKRIVNDEPFEVWGGASRYPIDALDALRIATYFIGDRQYWNRIFNVALRSFPVLRFVQAIERILGKPAVYRLINKGHSYEIPCPELATALRDLDLHPGDDYLLKVLSNYFVRPPSAEP
jgi:nucleoside-diphosphate-sugar epimerase